MTPKINHNDASAHPERSGRNAGSPFLRVLLLSLGLLLSFFPSVIAGPGHRLTAGIPATYNRGCYNVTVNVAPNFQPADGVSKDVLTVTVKDQSGTLVDGVQVNLTIIGLTGTYTDQT